MASIKKTYDDIDKTKIQNCIKFQWPVANSKNVVKIKKIVSLKVGEHLYKFYMKYCCVNKLGK